MKHVVCIAIVAALTMNCSGGGGVSPASPTPRPASGLTFTTPNLSVAVGVPNTGYSFCRPPITGNDLCGAASTNPTGGQPPYSFQLGAGSGFPPIGMHLNLNGTLTGTPTVAGVSNFVVCAVDLSRNSACDTVRFTVEPGAAAPPASPPPAPPAGGSTTTFVSSTGIECVGRGNGPVQGTCTGRITVRVGQSLPVGTAVWVMVQAQAFLAGSVTTTTSPPGQITIAFQGQIQMFNFNDDIVCPTVTSVAVTRDSRQGLILGDLTGARIPVTCRRG
jgi:hypothetical protein